MKKIFYLLACSVALIMSSCAEDRNELQDLNVEGAVLTTENVAPGFFNLVSIGDAFVAFDLVSRGDAVTGVTVYKSYNGGDVVQHSTIGSLPANVSITAAEAIDGLGISLDDLVIGDVFDLTFEFQANGKTYRSGLTQTVAVSCASDLAGTYDVVANGTSTDPCCPDATEVMSTITVTDEGSGNYTISDWSGGLYFTWYEVYGMTADGTPGEITDICNELTLTTSAEPFGESLTGSGTVDAATGDITFTWSNGWGDQGTSTWVKQ